MAEGRPPQDQVAVRVTQQVGQVGRAAGKLFQLRHSRQTGNLRLEEGVHAGEIEFFAGAHRHGLVEQIGFHLISTPGTLSPKSTHVVKKICRATFTSNFTNMS